MLCFVGLFLEGIKKMFILEGLFLGIILLLFSIFV